MAEAPYGLVALVMGFLDLLSLTPEQSTVIGGWALLSLLVLDLAASADRVPLNTPRDWVLWLTQWKSGGFWRAESRERARREGRTAALRSPLNYLPLTGAAIPFMFAAAVGHFFHPGLEPIVLPGTNAGIAICSGVALVISVLTYFGKLGRGERVLLPITAAGLLCGAVVWPTLPEVAASAI